jgi:predicted nucleotide-binding protein
MTVLTTISGQCFEAQYLNVGPAEGRDGVLYYFRVRDLFEDRGVRSVSIFRSGTERVFMENYDTRIETVRLNVLRRAFDSGTFSFETPVIPDRFHELRLTAADFKLQKKASDIVIRRFIKFGAYCLGFKHSPHNANNFYVDFDCPDDLEYLGAQSQDISRNVRLLIEEGFLRPSRAATFAHPDRVEPTAKLIREVESGVDEAQLLPAERPNASRKIFLVHGHAEDVNQTVAAYLKSLGLDVVILRDQPNQGKTIIEKFEKHSDVGFAVVLLTPDDSGASIRETTETKKRARQNVILELGYFIAKLGRHRVCPIYVGEVELPSDLLGVLWVRYDKDGEWRSQLAREIDASGINVEIP